MPGATIKIRQQEIVGERTGAFSNVVISWPGNTHWQLTSGYHDGLHLCFYGTTLDDVVMETNNKQSLDGER